MSAGQHLRREAFFRGSRADTSNEMGMQNALLILRGEIEKLANASGLSRVSEADMSRMLAAGQQHLLAQGGSALLNFRAGSSLVTQLAQQAFNGTLGTPSQATLVALKQQAQAGDGVGVTPGEKPLAGTLRGHDPLTLRNSNLPGSSSRFAELAEGANPIMNAARELATSLSGMAWATNNPDLLRLGPTAIRALHEAGVQERSFNRLTKDAGFSEKGAVRLAKRLHDMGLSPKEVNEHFEVTTRASEAMAGKDAGAQAEFEKRHLDLYTARTPEARAEAGKRMDEFIERNPPRPDQEKDVERYRGMVREQTGIELKAKVAAETKEVRVGAVNDAEVALLTGDGPSENKAVKPEPAKAEIPANGTTGTQPAKKPIGPSVR